MTMRITIKNEDDQRTANVGSQSASDDDDFVYACRSLLTVGSSVTVGGGAAVQFTIQRIR